MKFVDLSSNNEHPIDYGALVRAGYGAYVKATEGVDYVNPDFGIDYFGMIEAGGMVGAYHFWHPELPVDQQLSWFFQHYGGRQGDLPPMWDSEINPSHRSWTDLGTEMARVAWFMTARYGDAGFYLDRDWRDNLYANSGYPFGRKEWVALGVALRDIGNIWAVQVAPQNVGGLVDVDVNVNVA